MRPRPLLLLPTILLVAACAGSAAPTPVPPPSTPAPAVSATADTAGTGGPTAPPVAVAGSPAPQGMTTVAEAVDAELEAEIPATVSGMELDVVSLTAAEYLQRLPDSKLQTMITSTNLQADEVTIAIGIAEGSDGQLAIAAFRFPGVDESLLTDLFRQELSAEIPGVSMSETTIGGLDVVVIVDPAAPKVPVYLAVEQDIVRLVQASTHVLANAAVGALP